MHTFALAHFPHLHGIGRSSGKEIVTMFGFITSSSSSSCSLQSYSSGSITKIFANGERNQTYDCGYARFMRNKILDLMMSEEIFQYPIS